jgi:hypothetical protein
MLFGCDVKLKLTGAIFKEDNLYYLSAGDAQISAKDIQGTR